MCPPPPPIIEFATPLSASYLHQRNADVNSTKISFNLDCNLLVNWAKKVIIVLPKAGNIEI